MQSILPVQCNELVISELLQQNTKKNQMPKHFWSNAINWWYQNYCTKKPNTKIPKYFLLNAMRWFHYHHNLQEWDWSSSSSRSRSSCLFVKKFLKLLGTQYISNLISRDRQTHKDFIKIYTRSHCAGGRAHGTALHERELDDDWECVHDNDQHHPGGYWGGEKCESLLWSTCCCCHCLCCYFFVVIVYVAIVLVTTTTTSTTLEDIEGVRSVRVYCGLLVVVVVFVAIIYVVIVFVSTTTTSTTLEDIEGVSIVKVELADKVILEMSISKCPSSMSFEMCWHILKRCKQSRKIIVVQWYLSKRLL